MGVIYSPLLLVTACLETCSARRIQLNRDIGEEDDDDLPEEWEEAAEEVEVDLASGGWRDQVAESKPNIEVDPCMLEVRELKEQVKELTALVKSLAEQRGRGHINGAGAGTDVDDLEASAST